MEHVDKITLHDALENPAWKMVWAVDLDRQVDVRMSYNELRLICQLVEEARDKTMTEWISVKERLPEETGFYLIYMPKWTGHMEVCFYSVYSGWETGSHVYLNDMITHWRPLPEQPGKEGESQNE